MVQTNNPGKRQFIVFFLFIFTIQTHIFPLKLQFGYNSCKFTVYTEMPLTQC